jgi:uncharacterized protein YlxW (UPF0749 family)
MYLSYKHMYERTIQLESDLATAEQDSRQKQARIERLEKAVKELREALQRCAGQSYSSKVRYDACSARNNTEDAV